MKKILTLLMAFVSLTCFSCGQDIPADEVAESTEETTNESATEQDEISAFAGKWQGVKIIEDDVECTEFMDIPMYACYQFELCEDGFIKFGETTSRFINHNITWKWRETSSTEIEFYSDDDDISVLTLDGDYLIYEEYDNVLYFEKVEEFTPYEEEETTERTSHDYIDADPTAFIGQWEIKKLTVNSEKQYLMGLPVIDVCSLEIYDDGTAVISGVEVIGDENLVNCTWGMVSENEMELTGDNGNIISLILDGDYLTFENKDIKISFMKTNESVADVTENSFVGKWQGVKIVTDGEECTEIIDMPVYAIYQIELCRDGSVKFGGNISSLIYSNIAMGWRRTSSGTEIELYRDEDIEDVEVFRLDGDYLVCEDSGDFLYFEKVDEFTPFDMEAFMESFTEQETEESTTEPKEKDPFMCKWQGEYIIDENGEKLFDDVIPEFYQIELKEDGVVELGGGGLANDSLYSWEYVDTETIKFVPIVSEETLLFVLTGEYYLKNLDGKDYLVYEFNGKKAYLERVDEFVPVDFGNFDESEDKDR